jgi:hypothetical protein
MNTTILVSLRYLCPQQAISASGGNIGTFPIAPPAAAETSGSRASQVNTLSGSHRPKLAKLVDANQPRGVMCPLPEKEQLGSGDYDYCFLRRSATIWSKPFSFIVLLKRSR